MPKKCYHFYISSFIFLYLVIVSKKNKQTNNSINIYITIGLKTYTDPVLFFHLSEQLPILWNPCKYQTHCLR